MKKNVMMKLASFLLVGVMLSTSAISGTYAKYVTADEGSDTARVAKFGVEVSVSGSTFANEYAKDDNSFTLAANSVVSCDSDENVVAPGTQDEMAAIEITGTPEVAVRVTYDATVDLNDNWVDEDGNFYCPLIIYINENPIYGLGFDSAEAMETALMNIIKDYSKDYEAKTTLEDMADENLAIRWEWPFSTGAENDERDTYLGDQAADGEHGSISIDVSATVTQIN